MARKPALSARTLKTLGSERLAALLMETSKGNSSAQERLRLALAEASGAEEHRAFLRRRLHEISLTRTYVEGEQRKRLHYDLEVLLQAIIKVSREVPADGLDLLWRFLALAKIVYERCDDSSGKLGSIFEEARQALANAASATVLDPKVLADKLYDGLTDNRYGEYDTLVSLLRSVLGFKGFSHLRARLEADEEKKNHIHLKREINETLDELSSNSD